MVIPVLIFLAFNHDGPGAHGWGVAMSTDTALALGLLALLGRGVPDQVRLFLLTVFVVDDLVALIVIAVVYSEDIELMPLIAVLFFALMLGMRALRVRRGVCYVPFGVALWAALLASGVDPVVSGLAIGLTATAYTPARGDLDRPAACSGCSASSPPPNWPASRASVCTQTLSPNDRLQRIYHPWTSYVIVPLFGLANAGITSTPRSSARRRHLADHPGRAVRVRPRQAGRRGRRLLAAHQAQPRPDPAGRRLGRRAGQRDHRRHRLHRLAADRQPGPRGRRAGRGQDRRARRRGGRVAADLGRVPGDRRAAQGRGGHACCSATPSSSST